MQLTFKSKARDEHAVLADKVYAAMETGNTATARTLIREYADRFADKAAALRSAIVKDYGVRL